MGADIYESYVGAMVSAIILAITLHADQPLYVTLPLVLATIGLTSSAVGLLSNLVFKAQPAAMLRNATYVAIIAYLAGAYWYLITYDLPIHFILCNDYRMCVWYGNWFNYRILYW